MFCCGFRGVLVDIFGSRLKAASNIESPIVYISVSNSDPSGVFSNSEESTQRLNILHRLLTINYFLPTPIEAFYNSHVLNH